MIKKILEYVKEKNSHLCGDLNLLLSKNFPEAGASTREYSLNDDKIIVLLKGKIIGVIKRTPLNSEELF